VSIDKEATTCGVEWGPASNRRICTLEKGHSAIRNGFGHWCPDTTMTVTVSGPQGCGKTVLLKLLRETVEREWGQQIVAVRFEERQTSPSSSPACTCWVGNGQTVRVTVQLMAQKMRCPVHGRSSRHLTR